MSINSAIDFEIYSDPMKQQLFGNCFVKKSQRFDPNLPGGLANDVYSWQTTAQGGYAQGFLWESNPSTFLYGTPDNVGGTAATALGFRFDLAIGLTFQLEMMNSTFYCQVTNMVASVRSRHMLVASKMPQRSLRELMSRRTG